MDQETSKILTDGEKIKQTLESDGWQIMAERLDRIIGETTDIRAFKQIDKAQFAEELQRRLDAVSLIEEWLSDIKGEVTRVQDIVSATVRQTHTYIIRK